MGYVLKTTLDNYTEYQLIKKVIFKILIFVLQTHINLIYVKHFPYSCKLGYVKILICKTHSLKIWNNAANILLILLWEDLQLVLSCKLFRPK